MHPVSKTNFGAASGRIQVKYNNGTSVVTGYVVKQLGVSKFKVTSDGTTFFTVTLLTAYVSDQDIVPGTMVIEVKPQVVTYSGSVSSSAAVMNDSNANASSATTLNHLATAFVAGDTLSVNGVVLNVVASGAAGNDVNVTDTVGKLVTNLSNLDSHVTASFSSANGLTLTFTSQSLVLSGMFAKLNVTNGTTSGTASSGNGTTEHAKKIVDSVLTTLEGNKYVWKLGTATVGQANVATNP